MYTFVCDDCENETLDSIDAKGRCCGNCGMGNLTLAINPPKKMKNNDNMDAATYAHKSMDEEDRKQLIKNGWAHTDPNFDENREPDLKVNPGEVWRDDASGATFLNGTDKNMFINPASVIEKYKNKIIEAEKPVLRAKIAHPHQWGFLEKKRQENEMEYTSIKRSQVTHITLGQHRIKPTYFRRIAEFDEGIECFKIEYEADSHPIIDDNATFVLSIYYGDGSQKSFAECFIVERNTEIQCGIRSISFSLKCFNKIEEPAPPVKLPWDIIGNPKKPDLFVMQDWKMDLTMCKVDIKTNRNTTRECEVVIYFTIELEENNDFGIIKGQPILYLEYPEGKFTFQATKTYIEKTITVEGKQFVPYQFESKLIKELLT